MKTPLSLAPALAAVLCLSGCIINVDSRTERTGRYVSATTLQQIEPGRTQDYVRALIGEPSSRTVLEGGVEIWKWAYTETKRRKGGLILVYSGNETESVDGATFVEFQGGVVVKIWQD